ncbi:cupin domain-containing protein [Streptomyces sp. NPDC054838]
MGLTRPREEPGTARPGRVPLPPAFTVKAATADTEGRVSLLKVTLAKDIPRHVHHRADECVYVLDGIVDIEFDDRSHFAPRGTFTLLPQGVPHACAAPPTRPLRVLQISSPGGWACYVEDLIEAGPTVLTAKINPIAARYHIEYEERRP